jgi:hypothetical protein
MQKASHRLIKDLYLTYIKNSPNVTTKQQFLKGTKDSSPSPKKI